MKSVFRGNPFLFFTIALISAVTFVFIRFDRSEVSPSATIQALYEGNARIPYQYRVLPLLIARAAAAVAPDFSLYTENPKILEARTAAAIPDAALIALLCIEVFSLIVLLSVTAKLLGMFGFSEKSRNVLPLLVYYPLSFQFLLSSYHRYWYPSDLPSVAIFTLGIWLILEDRVMPFLLLFTIGTLNRETTIFLSLFYLLIHGRGISAAKIRIFAAQIIIWIAIKGALFGIYRSNGGAPFHPNLVENLGMIGDIRGVSALVGMFGALWLPVLLLLRFLQDRRLLALLVLIPIYLVGMLCVGYLPEARIYAELSPAVLILALSAIRSFLRPTSS